MTVAAAPAPFSMGRVITRLFGVLGRNIVLLLLLSALLVGLPTAVFAYIQLSMIAPGGVAVEPLGGLLSPLRIILGLAVSLVGVVGNAVLQGAVIHATVSDLSGRRPTFGESLGAGFRFFLPLVVIGLIYGACIVLGLVIFIVPGVLVALAWCVAAPAEVMERTGIFGAFSRSAELTRNHRVLIFVLALALFLAEGLARSIFGAVLGLGLGAGAATAQGLAGGALQSIFVAQMVTNLVLATLFASVSQAGVASVYFELRHAKEGIGVEQLAAVFD